MLKRCAIGNGTTRSTERYVHLMLMLDYKIGFFIVLVNLQSSWPYPTVHTNESRLIYDTDAN